MYISNDIKIIRELLYYSQQDLAESLDIPTESINRWESDIIVPEIKNIDMIYSFAFEKKIYLNKIHEQMMKDEYNKSNNVVLFHGAKTNILGSLDLSHSKSTNDFGQGFYLGETFEQAATYIAYTRSNNIYAYELDLEDLKVIKFDVSRDWMFAIAYYRGWIDMYKDNKTIKDIISKIEESDIVIAPIADNKMFDLIDEFVTGMTTDLQCKHALSATNLGFQYVIKTDKALKKLKLLDDMFLCEKERAYYLEKRIESTKIGLDKVKIARIEYKNKGKYIGELLK